VSGLATLAHSATVTVDSTGDVDDAPDKSTIASLMGDPGTDLEISLREAIIAANNDTGSAFDTINFSAAFVILTSPLPTITSRVVIDGPDLPASPLLIDADGIFGAPIFQFFNGSSMSEINGLRIENSNDFAIALDGDSVNCIIRDMVLVGNSIGIQIDGSDGSSGHTIAGCKIGTDGTSDLGNSNAGLQIVNSSNNMVGGFLSADRNIISGNGIGIYITVSSGNTASGNKIYNNYIGMSEDGLSSIGNSTFGVQLSGLDADPNGLDGTLIGTNTGGDGGNLISGNETANINLEGNSVVNTVILANKIGTDATGNADVFTSFGKGLYITNGTTGNQIGDGTTENANLISGNSSDGIHIANSSMNTIEGNLIGVASDGSTALGNSNGIVITAPSISSSAGNIIGGTAGHGNIIASNDSYGVRLTAGPGVVGSTTITHNAIYDNGVEGIFFDGLENSSIQPPSVSAVVSTKPYRVQGTIPTNSTGESDTIQVFADGNNQGRYFLGEATVGEAESNFDIPVNLAPYDGMNITTTTTDQNGNTSEFSVISGVTSIPGIPPSVIIDVASDQRDPTNEANSDVPILFDVTVDEPVQEFTLTFSDFVNSGTAGALSGSVTTSDDTFFILRITGVAMDGTVIPTLPAGSFPDLAGNLNSDPSTNNLSDGEVLFDTVAPVIAVNALLTNVTSPELTGTVDDPAATITVDVNSSGPLAATNNGNGTWTLPGGLIPAIAVDGKYDVLAVAEDAATNDGSDLTVDELTIDTLAPVPDMSPIVTADSTPALTGTIDDDSAGLMITVAAQTVTATVASGTWEVADGVLSSLSDGIYDVELASSDPAGNSDSVTVTGGLTVDSQGPVITIMAVESVASRPDFSGTVSDLTNPTLMVTVDSQTFSATVTGNDWNATPGSDLPDGVFTIEVNAVDDLANATTESLVGGAVIDTLPPEVTVDTLVTNDTTPPLSGTVDDGPVDGRTDSVVVEVTVGGNTYTADNLGGGLWRLADNTISPALSAGNFEIQVVATDALGNAGTDGSTNELLIDLSLPVVTVTDLVTNVDMPEIHGTVTDGLSSTVEVTVNSNRYTADVSGTNWSATINNEVLPEDIYTVIATATDAANNEGTGTGTLTIDRTDPTIAITPEFTNSDAPVLTGNVSDTNLDTVTVTVNNVNYTPAVEDMLWEVTLPMLIEGAYDVIATAEDLAGNAASDVAIGGLVIDRSPPTLTVDRIVSAMASPIVTGSVSDDNSGGVLNVMVDNTDYTPTLDGTDWHLIATNIMSEGTYTVFATATDMAGNSVDAENDLIVDLTDPVVTVNVLITSDTTPVLSGTVSDLTMTTVSVTVDGANYPATVANGDWSVEILADPPLSDGTYDVAVTATDEALRTGSDATTNELTINSVAPTLTVATLVTNNQSPTLTGTAEGPFPIAGIDVVVGGESYPATLADGEWSAMIGASLSEASYDVTLTATDTNMSTSQQTFQNALIVDLTQPLVTVDTLQSNDTTPVLTGTVDDDNSTSIEVAVGGETYTAMVSGSSWSANVETALDDGLYDVTATATDAAGNSSSDVTTGELSVDTRAPVVSSFERSTSSPTNSASVDFTLAFSEEVNGVDVNDFVLVVDGEVQPPADSKALGGLPLAFSVEGEGNQYTVSVDTGSGDGTLAVQLSNDESIVDAAGNLLADDTFSSMTYVIDRTPPTLTFSSTATDPTNITPIPVTVTFSEEINALDVEQVSVTNASVVDVTGGGASFLLALEPDSEGIVSISADANAVTDLAGNPNIEGDSFALTYAMAAEGEGEGEGERCLAECTGDDVDRDGDGLDACVEACIGTLDSRTDSDGDGMADSFEFQFGLDPLRNDALEDLDLDDETNLDEFLGNSDPTDPTSPHGPRYIAQDGVDEPDAGFSGRPWRTINYALSQITPNPAQRQRILIRTGTYVEDVTLLENVILAGERGSAVTIMGQLTGAERAALRRVTITPAGDEQYLFDMNDVAMDLLDVIFMGTPERDRTGMIVDGAAPVDSLIDRCTFTSLGVGIDIGDAIPTIRRSTFGNIPLEFSDPPLPGAGIIIRDNRDKSLVYAQKSIGDVTDPNSGWNDFLLSIEGLAVINERNEDLTMQSNYWGTVDPAEFDLRVNGPAILEPVLAQSSAILASSVFCTVWDNVDQKRLTNGAVEMKISSFAPVSRNTEGVYVFPALGDGDYSVVVNAPGYLRGTASVDVGPGEVKSVTIAMRRATVVEDPPEDTGCPLMSDSAKSLANLQGDLFLGSLTILTMMGSARLLRRRES